MIEIVYVFMFLLGAAFGSFGSVLIWRFKGEITKDVLKGVLYGRSECPSCKHILGINDLFPIFSRLLARWKCRHCKTKISSFYIFLELVSGLVFVFSMRFTWAYLGKIDLFSNTFYIYLVFFTVINWLLVLTVFWDLLFYELSDFFWIFLALWLIWWQFLGFVWNFPLAFKWSIIFFLGFMFIYLFGKFYVRIRFKESGTEWFGWWDVIIWFLIGLMVPFIIHYNNLEWFDIYYLIFLYILLSASLWVVFVWVKFLINRGNQWQAIPFLPAMVLGFWILLLFSGVFIEILEGF